jgi:peptide/nickel transport system ATP-binding protein
MNRPSPPDAALLDIDALNVSIGARAIVKQVTLSVRPGEILGLVGASGSGKSVTALAVLQLLPTGARLSGAVHLRGTALTGMSEAALQGVRGRDVGMIFQEPMSALNPLMNIGEQVAETVRLHRPVSAEVALGMAREALDQAGLSGEQGRLDRYPHELSVGQRQRVAIAIALVLSPRLIIADEPTTALDVIAQAQVLALLRERVHAGGAGLILITHDMAIIAQMADRVAVMQDGQIIEYGETAQVLLKPATSYTRALLDAADLKPRRGGVTAATESKAADKAGAVGNSAAVLEVRDVVRAYPRKRRSLWRAAAPWRAVDGVSLVIRAGEHVGLVGESGAGKSSLLRVLMALEKPQAGEVHLLGEPFSTAAGSQLRRLRRGVQIVFQDPYGSFDPEWRVEQLIAEPFHLLDEPPSADERRRRVAEVLGQVGLSATDAQRYPHEFSGGQRQRIAIARALIIRPALIVFDEAVSALDVIVRAQILDLLAELRTRLNIAYLFVSHDLALVRSIVDRIYVMREGRIVEECRTEALFTGPRDAYSARLVAATPNLEAALTALVTNHVS